MKKFILCLGISVTCVSAIAQQRPNILYIMSDDHDANAISAFGSTLIQTPNIDRLAKEGMLFNRAFVGNSICGPARATLLTGQHSHKNGIKDNRTRFDSSRITLPKILQQSGYQTAIVGKWHLQSYPTGFDYWKVLPGQGLYFEPRLIDMKGDTATYHGYATEVITNDALQWMKEKEIRQNPLPFYCTTRPHTEIFLHRLNILNNTTPKHFPNPLLYMLIQQDTELRGVYKQ